MNIIVPSVELIDDSKMQLNFGTNSRLCFQDCCCTGSVGWKHWLLIRDGHPADFSFYASLTAFSPHWLNVLTSP